MPNVDGKDYSYTPKGVSKAKKAAKASGKSMSYHNPGPEKDDVRRAAMGMLDRLPEIMGKEKIAGISISLMFNPPMGKAKKGKTKKDFSPHMMYDPQTGEGEMANTFEEHMEMKEKGFTHDMPEKKDKETAEEENGA
tara:strand:- start:85 stop:495 length:411 start_codon:yes stop_codon:yes gene_type:complete